ncbi:MAG TPA: dethiobiotin synthase [Steroidobacter sp.]
MSRPERLVVIVGTGTEVGKTWCACRLLSYARAQGLRVAARKPAQSFQPGEGPTDAELLAAASGESPEAVCPPHRRYPVAMAPPMAADVLGRARITIEELISELTWPEGIDLGLVETAGGVRSPLTHDADNVELVRRLSPDRVLLVADAGLGTLNSVRLCLEVLAPANVTVLLNRFDPASDLHRRNREWLGRYDGIDALTRPEDLLPPETAPDRPSHG